MQAWVLAPWGSGREAVSSRVVGGLGRGHEGGGGLGHKDKGGGCRREDEVGGGLKE